MIAVLCTRAQSPYWGLGLDCYDARRNAYSYDGNLPVIAHPPCRAWGRYKNVSLHDEREKLLGPFCVEKVRQNGGVLEHPQGSSLFRECDMPRPGYYDHYGGFTVLINQSDFGHRGIKPSWLYFVGCEPVSYDPIIPASFIPVQNMGRAERERTPPLFATWLVECVVQSQLI